MSSRLTVWLGVVVMVAACVAADDPEQEALQLNEQGTAAFDAGRYADAAQAFERADTLAPNPNSATNAAVNYLWAGQCGDAWTVLRRLLQRSAEIRQDADIRRVLQTMARELDAPQWRVCSLAVRLVRAIDLARGMAVENDAPETDARWFAQLAREHYEAGRYDAAALFYQVSYDGYPIPDVLHNTAMALHCSGQHRQAIAVFDRFIAETPDLRTSDAVMRALHAATAAADPSEVEACVLTSRIRQAIASVTGDPVTDVGEARRLFHLGVQQHGADRFHDAAVTFECSDRLATHPRIMLNVARCRKAAGEWRLALEAVDRYLERMPTVAADPVVARARAAFDDEPYATGERATVLFEQLDWAIERIDPRPVDGSEGRR
jgi:tetratricopeptide (TPR) repeat protein